MNKTVNNEQKHLMKSRDFQNSTGYDPEQPD